MVRVDILVNLLIGGNLAERELMSSDVVGCVRKAPNGSLGQRGSTCKELK